ncbi:MAG: hypothetical protein HOV80_03455 [Polyangiaceae bacterium]|nr:hypothetical protein [Polyangiaceae bacterium]
MIVAVGAYLGLRERGSPEVSTPTATVVSTTAPTATPTSSAAPARAPEGIPPQPVPSVTPELIKASSSSASNAIEKHRKHLVEKCWNPSAKTDPEPKSVTYTLELTFDAEGKQIARGLSEPRGASRPAVPQCLQTELPNLTIDPPGVSVAFKVELTLP